MNCFSWTVPLLLTALGVSAQQVTLHLQPDAQSKVITHVDLADPRLEAGDRVLSESRAQEGWHWGEFVGSFVGYVENSQMGKDLTALEGTLVYALPDLGSSVLTTLEATDAIEVLDTGAWWEISFSKPIPVYFIPPQPEAPPVLEPVAEPVEPLPAEPAAEALPTTRETAPLVQPEAVGAVDNPPVPLQSPGRPAEAPAARSPAEGSVETPVEAIPQQPVLRGPPPADDITRRLSGRLEQSPKRLFVFNPDYPFMLVDADGQRLAWVDFAGATLSTNPARLLGKRVTITGRFQGAATDDVVIFARTLRAAID